MSSSEAANSSGNEEMDESTSSGNKITNTKLTERKLDLSSIVSRVMFHEMGIDRAKSSDTEDSKSRESAAK
jgi:phosphoenolpyruvate-protein kinase (PTS system EI component)